MRSLRPYLSPDYRPVDITMRSYLEAQAAISQPALAWMMCLMRGRCGTLQVRMFTRISQLDCRQQFHLPSHFTSTLATKHLGSLRSFAINECRASLQQEILSSLRFLKETLFCLSPFDLGADL